MTREESTVRKKVAFLKEDEYTSIDHLSEFDLSIRTILDERSPTFTSLRSAISRWLKQFRLEKSFGEYYIINEAYIRGENAIRKKGIQIKNPSAWMRATCYNIIRELSRKESRYYSLLSDPIDESQTNNPKDSFNLDQELMRVKLSFQMLDDEDQEILNLKVVQGLSWSEISEEMNLRGIQLTNSALRKRKERALKRLREHYHNFAALNSCSE